MSPAKEPIVPQPSRPRDYPTRDSASPITASAPIAGQQLLSNLGAIGGPSPLLIHHLQQTIGNRTVGTTLQGANRPIQRDLPDAAQYLTLDERDLLLVAVGTAVANYNAIAATRDTAGGLQTCFNRLQGVERAINAWFATVSTRHRRLQDNPHAATIKRLMAAAELEHQTLVDLAKSFATVLPMDTTDLEVGELDELRTLWQDIVNSRGKIKLVGSAGYQQRVLSELGKILATPTGRAMLRFLNIPKDGEIADSAAAALTNIYIGESISNLSAAVTGASPHLKDHHRSEAQSLGSKKNARTQEVESLTEVTVTPIVVGEEPNAEEFPPVTAATMDQVRTAAWSGRKGFTHGGKQYTFNQGTGAFVTSIPGDSAHAGRGAGNEIVTPSWVTMGHELGHAANMKAGATTVRQQAHDPLTTNLAGNAAAAEQWDNAEELLNIENVENSLRGEAGLSARSGHRTPLWVQEHAVRVRGDLARPLHDLERQDESWNKDAEWSALRAKLGRLKASLTLDDSVVQSLRNEVANFTKTKTTALLPGYLLQISSNQTKADLLMAALPDASAKTAAMLYLHKNLTRFAQIKKYLHMGFFKRRVSNRSEREEARTEMFLDLVNERRAIP